MSSLTPRSRSPLRASVPPRPRAFGGGFRSAFTLTELLITIGIIVIVLAVAVPAFNVLSGQRSLEGAQNQIAAELSLMRSRCQSAQREGGVVFYLDAATQRIMMRPVVARQAQPDTLNITPASRVENMEPVRIIDFLPESDPVLVPGGVAMQFLYPGDLPGGLSTSHRFTGFNRLPGASNAAAAFGGVILFDASGRIMVVPVWLHDPTGPRSALAELFDVGNDTINQAIRGPVRSQIGLVLVDRAAFTGRFDLGEDLSAYTQADEEEERWLTENGVLLLLNRYNGTFVQ